MAAFVKQNESASKIVYSQHKDLVPKIISVEEKESEELQKEIDESIQKTKEALERIVNAKLSTAQPKNLPTNSSDSKFIKRKPYQQSASFNSGAQERIIRMAEKPLDPLELPKFKHKKIPKASGSPPVPVMHSPPRPVTVEDQQDWKVPPCISKWKNTKGYTIPLDKRLAADGCGLQEVQINDGFAKLSEALYAVEQKARVAVATRSKVQKELMLKEKDRKEQVLRSLAQKARSEKIGLAPTSASAPIGKSSIDDDDERKEILERDKIRKEWRRERERERRLMGKKSKLARDKDREISEKVVLGMANTGAGKGGEAMYDQRLFNQDKGMESGFAADDQYNVYDKGLFTAQPILPTLYRAKKDVDSDMYGGVDVELEKITKTMRFKPDKAFTCAVERPGKRDRPVELDKPEEIDPFGLDVFLTKIKKR